MYENNFLLYKDSNTNVYIKNLKNEMCINLKIKQKQKTMTLINIIYSQFIIQKYMLAINVNCFILYFCYLSNKIMNYTKVKYI